VAGREPMRPGSGLLGPPEDLLERDAGHGKLLPAVRIPSGVTTTRRKHVRLLYAGYAMRAPPESKRIPSTAAFRLSESMSDESREKAKRHNAPHADAKQLAIAETFLDSAPHRCEEGQSRLVGHLLAPMV